MRGDAEREAWDSILNDDEKVKVISGVDVLIAPHHGRKSGGNDNYLEIINPKLTLFGNAPSKRLAYNKFRNGDFRYITQNQAGNIVLKETKAGLRVCCSNKDFAQAFHEEYQIYNQLYSLQNGDNDKIYQLFDLEDLD